MKTKLLFVKPEELKPNPLNSFEIGNLDDMKSSIKNYGIITPLSAIGPYDDGTYRLISGERRYRSFSELPDNEKPSDKLPVYIIGDGNISETYQKLMILVANVETRDENTSSVFKVKLVETLKELVKQGEIDEREIASRMAKYLKTSTRYGRYWARVFNSDNNELKDMVKEDVLSIKSAGKILSMEKEQQEQVIKDIKNGESASKAIHNVGESNKAAEQRKEDKPKKLNDLLNQSRISLEDLDDIDMEDINVNDICHDPDINLASDTSGRIGELFEDYDLSSDTKENKSHNINAVISWCDYIKNSIEPTPEEWNAIYACIEVAERFS